ncbi:MAG: HIT family protein [Candidatus Harrisonbacteria bacterium CG10_big_fil_rev_8_21_14_0_10_44_23]|uniref:HIT family protein n=1 Tax=Candidatus Harrisonbacteria bacterium CG10_big_fil_rev_8_21_14_0_10_44_23 TaxID=1974585 RepID=A0A2H0UQ75_9BACT|nr:MAG: HIT family protein [Candidatus Harrisonbacteria bacterium CG10_big_fil_rev_8_21_14_0_10_44_23]
MSTIFEKIISKEIPAEILYEDENTLAFLDANPCSEGHTLVIPKKAVSNLIEADEETVSNLFKTVKRVTKTLAESDLDPVGFSIGINHGEEAGQSINHLHVHIIPRYKGDGDGTIRSMHSIVSNPPTNDLNTVFNKIIK